MYLGQRMAGRACETESSFNPGTIMNDDPPKPRSQADAELEREIRAERTFSLEEAIGRMAGPGAMQGVSPISRKRQAEMMIQEYLDQHLADGAGVLPGVLLRQVTG